MVFAITEREFSLIMSSLLLGSVLFKIVDEVVVVVPYELFDLKASLSLKNPLGSFPYSSEQFLLNFSTLRSFTPHSSRLRPHHLHHLLQLIDYLQRHWGKLEKV